MSPCSRKLFSPTNNTIFIVHTRSRLHWMIQMFTHLTWLLWRMLVRYILLFLFHFNYINVKSSFVKSLTALFTCCFSLWSVSKGLLFIILCLFYVVILYVYVNSSLWKFGFFFLSFIILCWKFPQDIAISLTVFLYRVCNQTCEKGLRLWCRVVFSFKAWVNNLYFWTDWSLQDDILF